MRTFIHVHACHVVMQQTVTRDIGYAAAPHMAAMNQYPTTLTLLPNQPETQHFPSPTRHAQSSVPAQVIADAERTKVILSDEALNLNR
jgi:hypothetical protein